MTIFKIKPMTRTEMAALGIKGSKHGQSVVLADGSKWLYDERFMHWACVYGATRVQS